jgi:FkbM family methyltransferase
MSSTDVLWDVGANVGPYTLIAAKAAGPGATVVAVEPAASSFDALVRNITHNRADNVIPLCVALSDQDGVRKFTYASLLAGEGLNALAPDDSHGVRTGMDGEPVHVPVLTMTLDSLVERCGLPPPTHLKVDVERGELAVLAGAARTLGRPSAQTIMVEADSPDHVEEARSFLAQVGFELAKTFWKSPRDTALDTFYARDPARLRALLHPIPDRRPRGTQAPRFV